MQDRFYVERKHRWVPGILSVLMATLAFVVFIPVFVERGLAVPTSFLLLMLGAVACVVVLAQLGSRKRWQIAAVLESQHITGGVLVTVIDIEQGSHQLLTDESTSRALSDSLAGD